jgi:hypothetical protein
MLSITSDAAGLESVSRFHSAPQTVTVVAALQRTAAHGLRQIADSGCPNTRNTRCSAETARMPLAVAFMSVAGVISDEFVADSFHRTEPAEPKQESRCVGVLRLPVEAGQLEDERSDVVRACGAS